MTTRIVVWLADHHGVTTLPLTVRDARYDGRTLVTTMPSGREYRFDAANVLDFEWVTNEAEQEAA